MVELSLMASAAFAPAILHQDQGLCRAPRDVQALLPCHDKRQEMLRAGLQLDAPHFELPCQSINLLSEFNQQAKQVLVNRKPVLIDVQDVQPDSVLFSFGIAEQCTRREKILQFLMSGSNIVEGEGLNLSLLSDLMGLHTLAIDMSPQQFASGDDEFCLYEVGRSGSWPSIGPQKQLHFPRPILDIIGNMSCSSLITACPDGQVLFIGPSAEIKKLISAVSEFYLPKIAMNGSKQTMLVPYFTRFSGKNKRANTGISSSKLQTHTVAPPKSSETIKLKPLPKKKRNKNGGRERDLYNKNYSHACETLMSFILNRKGSKLEILSLKKSGPEISQLLTRFSAGIAGTGLAVLFSVMYKIAIGRASFCTAKLWNTGFGLVLVWISLAVNGLRDTIIQVTKNSGKLKLTEEEITVKVQQSVNGVFFRAAALMAVALLRFA